MSLPPRRPVRLRQDLKASALSKPGAFPTFLSLTLEASAAGESVRINDKQYVIETTARDREAGPDDTVHLEQISGSRKARFPAADLFQAILAQRLEESPKRDSKKQALSSILHNAVHSVVVDQNARQTLTQTSKKVAEYEKANPTAADHRKSWRNTRVDSMAYDDLLSELNKAKVDASAVRLPVEDDVLKMFENSNKIFKCAEQFLSAAAKSTSGFFKQVEMHRHTAFFNQTKTGARGSRGRTGAVESTDGAAEFIRATVAKFAFSGGTVAISRLVDLANKQFGSKFTYAQVIAEVRSFCDADALTLGKAKIIGRHALAYLTSTHVDTWTKFMLDALIEGSWAEMKDGKLEIVRARDIVIVDETAVSSANEDSTQNRTHVGPAAQRDGAKLVSVGKKCVNTHVTHVAGFNAAGDRMPMVFIVARQSVPDKEYRVAGNDRRLEVERALKDVTANTLSGKAKGPATLPDINDVLILETKKGSINQACMVAVVKHLLKNYEDKSKVMLLLDMHNSRESDEFNEWATEQKLSVYCYLPNATSVMQAPDRYGFHAYKSMRNTVRETYARALNAYGRIAVAIRAYQITMTGDLIKKSVAAVGLNPWDPTGCLRNHARVAAADALAHTIQVNTGYKMIERCWKPTHTREGVLQGDGASVGSTVTPDKLDLVRHTVNELRGSLAVNTQVNAHTQKIQEARNATSVRDSDVLKHAVFEASPAVKRALISSNKKLHAKVKATCGDSLEAEAAARRRAQERYKAEGDEKALDVERKKLENARVRVALAKAAASLAESELAVAEAEAAREAAQAKGPDFTEAEAIKTTRNNVRQVFKAFRAAAHGAADEVGTTAVTFGDGQVCVRQISTQENIDNVQRSLQFAHDVDMATEDLAMKPVGSFQQTCNKFARDAREQPVGEEQRAAKKARRSTGRSIAQSGNYAVVGPVAQIRKDQHDMETQMIKKNEAEKHAEEKAAKTAAKAAKALATQQARQKEKEMKAAWTNEMKASTIENIGPVIARGAAIWSVDKMPTVWKSQMISWLSVQRHQPRINGGELAPLVDEALASTATVRAIRVVFEQVLAVVHPR
jgi:hypothetical protein